MQHRREDARHLVDRAAGREHRDQLDRLLAWPGLRLYGGRRRPAPASAGDRGDHEGPQGGQLRSLRHQLLSSGVGRRGTGPQDTRVCEGRPGPVDVESTENVPAGLVCGLRRLPSDPPR